MTRHTDNQRPLHWKPSYPSDGHLLDNLPELTALQGLVENNDWHNDTPWAQSFRLMQWMTGLPKTLWATLNIPEQPLKVLLSITLDGTNGRYPLQGLLSFTALIHDVGKAETFQRHPDGSTRCPGHEAAGAKMASTICQRFDFTTTEVNFITTLVKHHGEPYALFKQICDLSQAEQKAEVSQFEAQHASYLQPLLLLAYGDMTTSHLKEINPVKFAGVSAFYQGWLQKVFQHG